MYGHQERVQMPIRFSDQSIRCRGQCARDPRLSDLREAPAGETWVGRQRAINSVEAEQARPVDVDPIGSAATRRCQRLQYGVRALSRAARRGEHRQPLDINQPARNVGYADTVAQYHDTIGYADHLLEIG
jgi:hypothetical protein